MLQMVIRWMAKVTIRSSDEVRCDEVRSHETGVAVAINFVFGVALGIIGVLTLIAVATVVLGEEKAVTIYGLLGVAAAVFVAWIVALRIVEIYLDVKEGAE